ncbi:helix-turn-helix domain-containing protein [Streptomyces sp. NPDC047821]|uniref:helix-turn-helix domain-containing protein n=1 Tax=Streptomyces sp. NPDC047821 TaxID=3365488 RepID=UPI00371B82DE
MGTETEGFAEALRGLKERSGLSYGVLAKRAHMSTSTLHRYCNGDAVPTEFAPVERLARLCGASRDEMVALHRRWIVADDAKRRGRAAATPGAAGAGDAQAGAGAGAGGGAGSGAVAAGAGDAPAETGVVAAGAGDASAETGAGDPGAPPPGPADDEPVTVLAAAPTGEPAHQGSRRRIRLVAAAAALVVLTASTALALAMGSGSPGPASAGAPPGTARPATAPASAGPSGSPATGAPTAPSPSAPTGTPTPAAGATAPSAAPSGAALPRSAVPDRRDGGVPLTVDVRPYVWRDPCSQVYVVDQPPARVPPPPSEQEARGWVTALGGAPGGDMLMELAVQGTGEDTVVLHALHVRVVEKDAPLPWNAYTMGVGCGGDMTPQSFDVNLDAARPRAVPVAGRQGDREIPAGDFPYKASASDPQVLRVTAHTAGYSVRWYLELEWSSEGRRGTLRIDDRGRPFATSAITGRPAYDHPLGGSGWIPHVPNEG